MANCSKCNKPITNKQCLTCSSCAKQFHLDCTSVSFQRFKIMTSANKKDYKCFPSCRSTPQSRNSLQPATTTNRQENITHRKKIEINVPTENSFETLTDEEEQYSSQISTPTFDLNRSFTTLRSSCIEDMDALKLKLLKLEQKLEIAENEICNLVSENHTLNKKLEDYELKIEQLTHICKTPTTVTSKKKSKSYCGHQQNMSQLNETSQLSSHEKNTANLPPIITNDTRTDTPKLQTSSSPKIKSKLCILSTNKHNGILSKAQNYFKNYSLCHYLTPNGDIKQQLRGLDTKLKAFTTDDYCIIFLGEEDFLRTKNYIDLIIYIRDVIQPLRHTNIIMCYPTYKIGKLNSMYNWRIEHFNNLLYLDVLTHEHLYLIDSNQNLYYDKSMFNIMYDGTINDHGINTVFEDLIQKIYDINIFFQNQFFR